ncbi:putative G-protein coupled receptor F59B2.13 [Patella vulgata]|uniref:putative G-protein coupled receptor F59B2.13 n=1 Tax=Patella vulgata TaxID=6465 RepID=UPI00218029E0|nr:putative G-protein coupled receptor F59B2.13 [Patella vulgata]
MNALVMLDCLNLTMEAQHNMSIANDEAKKLFEEVSHVVYGFGIPSVCLFGIFGNVLNLCILTRRKLQKAFKRLELSANLCLVSLAVSDLMFCFFAFPTVFLPQDDVYTSRGFVLYYRIYCAAIINVFIIISTWLTVAMALERYLAICHPLRQDIYLTTSRIKCVIVITYVFSFTFNIPVLWRYEVRQLCTNTSTKVYIPNPIPLWNDRQIDTAYRIIWAVIGNFIPLVLLLYFNVCLCRKIYKSYKMRQAFKRDRRSDHSSTSTSHTITITLVVIIVMFFILVAPSEIVIHLARITDNESNYTYLTIEAVMNFMQSVNFSVNFILYCIISPYFRKTLKYLFCCGCWNIYQVSKQWKKEFETSLM